MDPIIFRGIERLIIVLGGIIFSFLGYNLYKLGYTKGKAETEIKSSFIKFALSGSGPGLFFMAFGAIILVAALYFSYSQKISSPPSKKEIQSYLELLDSDVNYCLCSVSTVPTLVTKEKNLIDRAKRDEEVQALTDEERKADIQNQIEQLRKTIDNYEVFKGFLAQDSKSESDQSHTYKQMADVLTKKGEFDKAQFYLDKSLEIQQRINGK